MGIWLTLIGVAGQTFLHLVNVVLDAHADMVDVNAEVNLPTWFNVVAIFSAALACTIHATTQRAHAKSVVALGGLLAFLSLDEGTAIHERIASHVLSLADAPESWASVVWPLLYLPIMVATGILLLTTSRRLSGIATRLVTTGLVCLAAAVAAEIIATPFTNGGSLDDGVEQLEGALEEALELMGWGLIASALLGYLAWANASTAGRSRAGSEAGTPVTAPPRTGRGRRPS